MDMTPRSWIGALVCALAWANAQAARGQPAEPTGTLTIRAIQGTEGGGGVASGKAQVHLFFRRQLVRTIEVTLDESGSAVVPDLPIAMGIDPVVQIEHAGVTYQETGPRMDPTAPTASMEVVVFDVTDEAPPWSVEMRRIDAAPERDGVRVGELLRVVNPDDATWLGGAVASTGKRTTVRVSLPVGASDVRLDHGFHGWCCTTYEGGELAVQMPLMPGETSYHYSYVVPIVDGRASIAFSAPVPTSTAEVFVAERGGAIAAHGLADLGAQDTPSGGVRMFEGTDLERSAEVGIVLTGLSMAEQAAERTDTSMGSAMAWIGIGAGALVIVVASVVLLRGPKPEG